MTPRQSILRLCTYVNAAVLATFIGGVAAVDFSNWKQVAAFVGGILLAGNNAVRAYIDKSPSEVVAAPPEFKVPPMP